MLGLQNPTRLECKSVGITGQMTGSAHLMIFDDVESAPELRY